ncbi:DJ-1/PfpI family protein [Pseudomonas sp. B21-048]|uniref:DJ-1/PfpI family protein n=1 Tax=Pseudomonas sp. B21-048 TaxID=2895490 RepID=UPI002160395F|nr:DJ-1/PfpI family protein [Pseudomonas sp. B21-048]UVK96723.1 DJ-1/PfpI family protein [Pseudomonas sp. B21-048]
MPAPEQYLIAIPVYDGVDLLDVSAPYELFNWMARIEPQHNPAAPPRVVRLISLDGPSITTRDGLTLGGDLPIFDQHSEYISLLWIPGGEPDDLKRLMDESKRMNWLLRQGEAAKFSASVCEGALLAAAAGLLDGYDATTHWAFIACLKLFPQIKVVQGYPRYIVDRQRITGGGISSGLDEALEIIAMISSNIVAQKVQLTIQYNPDPPFNSGDPSVAHPPVYTPGAGSTCDFSGMAATIANVLKRKGSS